MSTLVAQTISNGTVSTSSANVIQGSAKAWVNFNGTGTVAIRSSYNVSSITDGGVGDYTINFTNALADANYSVIASSGGASGGNIMMTPFVGSTPTTTAYRLLSYTYAGGGNIDMPNINAAVFR